MKITPQLHHTILVILIFLIQFCSHASFCFAETLDDAWQLAIDTNHSLRAAGSMIDSAKYLRKAAQAARFPQVSLDVGYTLLNESPASLMNTGPESIQVPLGNDQFYTGRAFTSLPLYTSGSLTHGIKSAEFGLEATMAEQEHMLQNLKFKVAESFVYVLQAKRGVAIAQSHVKSLSAHRGVVEDLYKEGFVPFNDLLSIRVSLANAEQQLLTAMDRYTITVAVYNRFLGRPLATAVNLEDPDVSLVSEKLDELTLMASANRQEIVVLKKQIKSLKQKQDMVYASYGPQVALNGGYEYQENDYQVHEGIWSMTLGVSIKFDGGIAKHQSSALGSQREALLEQLSELESIIPLQVKDAWLNLANSRKRVEVASKALSGGEENLEVTTDRYQEGLATNSEVLDAEALRVISHVNYDNAVYDVVLAAVKLRHSIGNF